MANSILLPADALPLISLCDSIQCNEGFVHPDRIMDINVLLYVEKGNFHIYEKDSDSDEVREYTIEEGCLLFLKSGCHHYGDIKCPDGTKWFFVHFYLPEVTHNSLLIEPLDYFLYPENSLGKNNNRYYKLPKYVEIHDNHSLLSKFETLTRMYKSQRLESRLQMNAFFCQILMDIYREGIQSRKKSGKEEKVEIMLQYLEGHKTEPFSSIALEEQMHLSFKHLNLLFKEVTGTTLQKHHNRLRLDFAAKLLRETNLDIASISSQVSYEEPFYFSNSFKKQFGLSPRDYRKKQFFI